MSLSEHQLRYGYWPSRQLSGRNPNPIRYPAEYTGADTLNLACTQTALSTHAQRKLVQEWCSLLPRLPVKTILFSSKVNQALFDAAAANSDLEALFVKWSSVASLGSVAEHPRLASLHLGDSPSATGLDHLSRLPALRHLFLAGVREASDLSFAKELPNLVEFGLSGGSKPLAVESLEPLGGMHELAVLWLVRVRPRIGGLEPLRHLKRLQSFRSSFGATSREMLELGSVIPGLKYFQPVR